MPETVSNGGMDHVHEGQLLFGEGGPDAAQLLDQGGLGEKQVQMSQGVQAVSYRFSVGQQLLGQDRAQALLRLRLPHHDPRALEEQGFPLVAGGLGDLFFNDPLLLSDNGQVSRPLVPQGEGWVAGVFRVQNSEGFGHLLQGQVLPPGGRLQGGEVRRQAPEQQQIPLELEELHLVQVPLLQPRYGGADVPHLHEPLAKAAEGGMVPQGHGLAQVNKLPLQGVPFRRGIRAKGPLLLPAQGAQGQESVQHEVEAYILLLLQSQFHWVSSQMFTTGTSTFRATSSWKAAAS